MTATPSDDVPEELFRTTWLAARLREGDTGRFQELYERVAPALFAWSRLRIQPALRSRLDAQDVTQEVWFRALRRFEGYSPSTGSFRAWIFGIARTTLLEALRMIGPSRRAAPGANTSCFPVIEGIPESVTSIRSRLVADESIQRFIAFAAQVSAEDRQILIACGLEGSTCREAAQVVGLGEEAVTKRWQRLRALLREKNWSRKLLDESATA